MDPRFETRMRILRLAAGLLLGALGAVPVHAHTLGQSYVFLTVEDAHTLHGTFQMTLLDLDTALGTGLGVDRIATAAELPPHVPAIQGYLLERIQMGAAGTDAEIRLHEPRLDLIHGHQYVSVDFDLVGLPSETRALEITYRVLFDRESEHQGLLVIENDWTRGVFGNESKVALVFEPGRERQTLDLSGTSVTGGFLQMLRMGMRRFWLGFDHLFFVVALLLTAVLRRRDGRWGGAESFGAAARRAVTLVLLFALGHSLTVAAYGFGIVQPPSRLFEAVLALSIGVAALGVFVPVLAARAGIVAFAFGLFHGFGLTHVLTQLAISTRHRGVALLGFDLGIAIALAVVACVIVVGFGLLRSTRLYLRFALRPAALLLIAVSLYWFVERAFALDVPAVALVRRALGMA